MNGLSVFQTSLLPIILVSEKARGLPDSPTGAYIDKKNSWILRFDSKASTATTRLPATGRLLGTNYK
jgi:hypothetical protein